MTTATALLRTGLAAHQAGRLAEAAAAYREVIALAPDNAAAHYNLGRAILQRGHVEEALAELGEAVRLNPDDAVFNFALSEALRRAGRLEEARKSARRAIALQPLSADMHAGLGTVLVDLSRYGEAEKAFDEALRYHAKNTAALAGLARLHMRRRNFAEARRLLADAIRSHPADARLLVLLGDCFADEGRLTSAAEAYRRARTLDHANAEAAEKYDRAIFRIGGIAEARAALERAVAQSPNSAFAHRVLGDFLSGHGFIEAAAATYRTALAIEPANKEARASLAHDMKFRDRDGPEFMALQQSHATMKPDDPARDRMAYAMGKALDDLGEYTEGFACFAAANAIRAGARPYDLAVDAKRFAAVKETFTADLLRRHRADSDSKAAPIFIVGMPRSGTTLTETVLSGSSAVYACGELEFLRLATTTATGADPFAEAPRAAHDLNRESLRRIAGAYLGFLPEVARSAAHTTDKLPHNFRLIGLIRLVFPRAHIVHVRRNPLDNCLSMFKTPFRAEGLDFTHDLTDLGRYYNLYRDLMRHWHAVLPGEIFDLSYEDLVGDPEATARRLYAHCELEWTPAAIEVQGRQREVLTASFAQVRRPIYKDSVDLAARYGDRLDPLRAALAEWDDHQP